MHDDPPDPSRRLSRRTVLVVGGLAVAGCSDHRRPQPRPTTMRDPDAADLARARRIELTLVASYDAAIKRAPLREQARLRVARALHAVHLGALPDGGTGSRADLALVGDLAAELRGSAASLRAAAMRAHRGPTAALLASIAASHEASVG